MVSSKQVKAARVLLNWDQDDLAERAKISKGTVSKFEKGESSISRVALNRMVMALESAGIRFLSNGVTLSNDE